MEEWEWSDGLQYLENICMKMGNWWVNRIDVEELNACKQAGVLSRF